MKGISLTFLKKVASGTDALNNPTYTKVALEVEDCLIAPMTEPTSAREQQAIQQSRDRVRVHMPKAFTGDVSNSSFAWDGKVFTLDSDSVTFMLENTPTRWNRYFGAECVGQLSGDDDEEVWATIFVTEDTETPLGGETS